MPDGKEKTFQLDGEARIIQSDNPLVKNYIEKFPEKVGKWSDDIFFIVTAKWWRFTDWSRTEGKTIFSSDGTITVNKRI